MVSIILCTAMTKHIFIEFPVVRVPDKTRIVMDLFSISML